MSILLLVIKMLEKEILIKLYQNVEMGIIGIEDIEDKVESRSLLKLLLKQKDEYSKLKEKLVELCAKYTVQDKEVSSIAHVGSQMMVTMKTMMDKSDSHIATMMMEGTSKGLIQLEKLLNNYQGKDEDLIKFIENLLVFEQQNNEELKVYL